jgi:hypothetical protein
VTKSKLIVVLATLTLLLFQAGCEEKTVTPKETHWDAVRAIISEYPEVFRLGSFDTGADTLFYREITESNADIERGELVEEDTSYSGPGPFFPYIDLTWGDSLTGKFHYRFNDKWYEKPIRSIALIDGFFERWGDDYDPHLGWILKRFSGTVISSIGTTKHPSILYVVSSGQNDTITEPRLRIPVKKDSTLVFGPGELVTFTVEPSSDTSDFFFLHVDEGGTPRKIPFSNNGDETLSASWITTSNPDKLYCHAIVDIVSRESVTDTLADYNSKAWAIIYRIE